MTSVLDAVPRVADRTAEDWRGLLLAELNDRRDAIDLYESYYDGEHPLQFASSKFREAFGTLFGAFADNWCQIIVDAAVERLKIVGFQVDGSPNEEAWKIWQQNALDVESVIAHTEAGKSGRAFLLVDPVDSEGGGPRITVEHCAQVIVAHDPGDRRKRLAALKRWIGDDGYVYLTVYLPELVLKFESSAPVGEADPGGTEWIARTGEPAEVTNPLGVVPVIPLENKPGLLGSAHSDLESAVPLQNAVNKLCSDMIVASEYGAFPQRFATGVDVPKDPETGQTVAKEELKAAMSRLWTAKQPDASFGSLQATDLTNFVKGVEMLIQHLAAQTRTPPHYLLGSMVNTSGDALSVAEAGLVSKCRSKILFFSDAWEEAIALALTAAGTKTVAADCETMWSNPERVSVSQMTDAAIKKQTLNVPPPQIWLELGYTPEQIVEFEKLVAAAERKAAKAAKAQQDAAAAAAVAAAAQNPDTPPADQPPADTTTGGTGG